jgi:hypothetical protein
MRNFVIAITAMVAIAACSIIAGGGSGLVSCNDTDALLSLSYWRGAMGSGPELSACWLRGHVEAQAPRYTCAAGSHDIGGGRCCKDGYHSIEGGKCRPDAQ